MSYSIPVVPRAASATAYQVIEGATTASQLRDIDDRIDVGHLDGDERDLRWILVPTRGGVLEVHFGDWIVKDDLGVLCVVNAEEFAARFIPANEHARATLRARDVNDPRVQEAQRIAKAFSESLRAGEPPRE